MTESQSRNSKKKGQRTTGNPDEQAQQIPQQAQEKASEVAQQARRQVTSLAKTQKKRASQSLEQLQEQGQNVPAQAMTTAAQQVNRVAEYLGSHTVKEMVGEVEGFGRHRPGVFVGGSVAAGFLLSRFLKSAPPAIDTSDSGGNARRQ